LIKSEDLLGLPGYQITGSEWVGGEWKLSVRYTGKITCPHCQGTVLRNKGSYRRRVRHENVGTRRCVLDLEGCKFLCLACGRYFRQRFPGILSWQRSSEAFQKMICRDHLDGINRSRLARRESLGAATVDRYSRRVLQRQFAALRSPRCPRILGIDEHFFTRRQGFATTLCDLRNHTIYDVVLGRSEASLEAYFQALEGKEDVLVVCMDLSASYRALVKKYFPNARIVADRFHVIRLVNQHFLNCWREMDPVASKNRGLLSLMRRHRHNLKPHQRPRLAAYLTQNPLLEVIYRAKQRLCYLLLKKHKTRRQCVPLVRRLLTMIEHLKHAGSPALVQLGHTLESWSAEIACMWRFTRNNGITEGFHNKMETISRVAYGFRNFENYRLRVKVLCS
jgi:transposase